MIRASVSYAKNNLSALLSQVKQGETVLVTDREQPVAQIIPMRTEGQDQRLNDLIAKGIVKAPKRPLTVANIVPLKLGVGKRANLIDAVREDRDENY